MNAKILCALLTASWFAGRTATALDLVMTLDDSVPYIDPLGVDRTHDLVDTVEAASAIWEDLIEDEFTLEIAYGWSDLPNNTLGIYGSKLLFDTHDYPNGPARTWFIDPTPLDHSEFDFSMGQSLVRDADTDRGWFTGNVPDLLETGYRGRPAQQGLGFDLMSVALHEIGHWLGVNRFDAYAINPDFVGGAVMSIDADAGHLPLSNSLMNGTVGTYRELPSAADVFAAASSRGWTHIDLPRKEFFGRHGDQQWTNSLNWEGNQVPGARDDAYLRHGGTVRLTAASTEIQHVTDLLVADDTQLVIEPLARLKVDSDPRTWDSHGNLTLKNQSKIVAWGNSSGNPALEVQSMEISAGSTLSLAGSTVRIHGELALDDCDLDVMCPAGGTASQITGYGRLEVDARFVNGGRIEGIANPSVAVQRTLTFVAKQSVGTVWDLSHRPRPGEPAIGQIVASQGDVQFSGGTVATFQGQMLADNGYSIRFDTSTLSTSGRLTVRDISSFIFAPRIENCGSIELISGGSLRTLQIQNAGGTIRGDGRVVFSDSFTNDGGSILAVDGQTLAFAATSRNVHWNLAGSSPDSIWQASNRATVRFGAAAAEAVQFEPFRGSMLAESGSSIEFTFENKFEFPLGRSGRIDVVGPDSTLTAPHAALMIGVESGTSGRGVARARIDQGRLEVGALYVGGDDKGGIADGVLELNRGVVTASDELRIWAAGCVDGVGTINADVTNDGVVRLGALTGAMQIDGSFSQGLAGILAMDIASVESHERLVIGGQASLNGILELTFGERPSIGDSFDLMDYRSVTGGFRQIVLPAHMRAEFMVTTGELLITAVTPEPSAMQLLLLCIVNIMGTWRSSAARQSRQLATT